MASLPHCDELFLTYFDRWYDDDDRQRKEFEATRPDIYGSASFIGVLPADVSGLSKEGRREVLYRIETMLEAARGDWSELFDVSGEIDLAWIAAFDHYYDENRICALIEDSEPAEFDNGYLVTCCEFGAVLGHVMRTLQPRLEWCFEWPYWESALLDPLTGNLIPVFHWAIKKLSEYGWDDGFAEKVEAAVQILDDERARSHDDDGQSSECDN